MVHPHEREAELFEAALELPSGQREAYLAQASAGDVTAFAELLVRRLVLSDSPKELFAACDVLPLTKPLKRTNVKHRPAQSNVLSVRVRPCRNALERVLKMAL